MLRVVMDNTRMMKFSAPSVLKEKVLPMDADISKLLNGRSKVTTVGIGSKHLDTSYIQQHTWN
jgi:hypothetical protein